VQGIYEDHNLKIPSGTQSHQRFILSNKGIKRVHSSGYGDHYVYIKIKIPKYYVDSFTSEPSGQVARNLPLFGLFEVRKKRNTLYMVYTIYMVYILYMVYTLSNLTFKTNF